MLNWMIEKIEKIEIETMSRAMGLMMVMIAMGYWHQAHWPLIPLLLIGIYTVFRPVSRDQRDSEVEELTDR